ncbi:MAG: ABC transporter substrate-binding protein [Betaproteobacteria bacterium]|nr:MAG: ABC transporter substrate-binding protein [Betaproteobacteria bacterium]
MKRLFVAAALSAALISAGSIATPLRWASAGDPLTMDPHSQNEGLTNSMNGQVYETLMKRDKKLALAPALATEWKQIDDLTWRFKLRQNVKFHDGSILTPEDVVYSVERAKHPNSQIRVYANVVGTPKKIDATTVEFKLAAVNPIFLDHLATVQIMNKAWSEKNNATTPQNFKEKEEKHTAMNANGTGPFRLISRQPDVKTVYKAFEGWWGKREGNISSVTFTPIKADATRVAALVSGEVDFVLDPPPQDLERLEKTPNTKVIKGQENRIIFIGMDQARDELLYSNVKGKNPFKDKRVRQALYQSIDIETMKTKLMRGQAFPTGGITVSPLGAYNDAALEKRLPFDVAAAKKLMADAGYPQGFEVTLHCPNNRYINDEKICQALAAMWAQIGVKIRLDAQPRAIHFPRLEKLDTSMYMLGWGGAITDAETTMTPVLRNRAPGGIGDYNYGNYKNDKLDQAAAASSKEADPAKRKAQILTALRAHNEEINHLPLHRQVIPWAARSNLTAAHRPDNWLEWDWITIK